jgi:NagD protein
MARKKLDLSTDETIMIGDTMSTDILGAGTMGFTTVLTLSGVTKREDLEEFSYTPDFVVDSIQDLLDPEFFQDVIRKQKSYNSFV